MGAVLDGIGKGKVAAGHVGKAAKLQVVGKLGLAGGERLVAPGDQFECIAYDGRCWHGRPQPQLIVPVGLA